MTANGKIDLKPCQRKRCSFSFREDLSSCVHFLFVQGLAFILGLAVAVRPLTAVRNWLSNGYKVKRKFSVDLPVAGRCTILSETCLIYEFRQGVARTAS